MPLAPLLPELNVSQADAENLRELAESLAENALEEFQRGRLEQDASRWRELRQHEGVRFFEELPQPDAAEHTPSLLLRGSIAGTLDDMMFAHLAATDSAMLVKAHYVQDGAVESKVVAEVQSPTIDEPFNQVSVKWRLFNTRDYVFLDATGFLLSPSGERIGYTVSHSIGFEQLPTFESQSIDRGNISVCSLFRQQSPSVVECFARGYFDIQTDGDAVTSNLALRLVSTQWLSFTRHMQFAQMKKLLWWLKRSLDFVAKERDGKRKSHCCVCSKSLRFVPTGKKSCKRCEHVVCSGCQVKNRLCWSSQGGRAVQEAKEVFCSRCILEVVQSDAFGIAQDEIRHGGEFNPHNSSWSTQSSSED